MPYPKTEEREKESNIQAVPLSKKLLDNIDILDKILTREEKEIIDILNKYGPSTTKETRDHYILNLRKQKVIPLSVRQRLYRALRNSETMVRLPEHSKILEKISKEYNIKIPAYETFDNMLLSLEKLGLVARRYDPLKKAKWLWILNPSLLVQLKEKKLKIDLFFEKELDQLKETTEENKEQIEKEVKKRIPVKIT